MRFGIREVCDCIFTSIDGKGLNFIIDTAKMSTMESASTTVYAQGGRGFARLAAWEGEKTLTFTVENAILTTESFAALLGKGAVDTLDGSGKRYTLSADSYAGYYTVSAHTLWRDIETGADHACVITIPKAKLQSNISLSMAPNGDPAAFTFTFDAFAVAGDYAHFDIANAVEDKAETKVVIAYFDETNKATKHETLTVKGGSALKVNSNKKVELTDGATTNEQKQASDVVLKEDQIITNFANISIADSDTKSYPVDLGGTTYLHII